MKQNNKSRIDYYETPYEVYLAIANKYTTFEELQEIFTYSDGVELDDNFLNDSDGYPYQGVTVSVKRKSDNRQFILVKHVSDTSVKVDKLLDIINLADHEACHAILDLYKIIGAEIDLDNQEHFAYEKSYITTLILKNWLNK
jgi:hypothetical protein